MSVIDSSLKFKIYDLEIYEDEAVYDMVDAHSRRNDVDFRKAFDDYKRYRDLLLIARNMLDGGLQEWDLKWAFETGNMCKNDFDMLESEFLKLGITREDYENKWKREA